MRRLVLPLLALLAALALALSIPSGFASGETTAQSPVNGLQQTHYTIVSRAANQVITNNTWTPVSWDTVIQDDVGGWSAGSPDIVTVPTGYGHAQVRLYTTWENAGTNYRFMSLDYPAGTAIEAVMHQTAHETSSQLLTRRMVVTPGQTFKAWVYQNSGSNKNLGGTGFGVASYIEVKWEP